MTQINRNQLKNQNLTGASLVDGIGIYSEMNSYSVDDTVFWQGTEYKCVSAVTATIEGDLSNAPDISTDWEQSASAMFSCYPTNSQSFTNSRITINFNTVRLSDPNFSLSAGEVTFNESGKYIVSMTVSIDRDGNRRTGANAYIQIDTGSGFADIPNLKISTFNYSSNPAQESCSITIPIDISKDDKIRVQTIRYSGNRSMKTIPDGCNITIFNTKGSKGIKGIKGDDGLTGPSGDLSWQGTWSSQSYNENDTVEYNGSCFVCVTTGTTTNPGTPISPNTGWELVAKAGTDGSGTAVNISDDGTSLANTPHSTLNFTGDLTASDAGSGVATINYTTPKNTYMLPIWAEENAKLGNNTYEWAFGNGANTPNDGGITIFVPSGYSCEVVGMSLRVGGGTATVELVLNGTLQGSNCNVILSSGQSATNTISPPISISNNDYINFRTTSTSGSSGPNVVSAWLKYTEN